MESPVARFMGDELNGAHLPDGNIDSGYPGDLVGSAATSGGALGILWGTDDNVRDEDAAMGRGRSEVSREGRFSYTIRVQQGRRVNADDSHSSFASQGSHTLRET